MNMARCHIYNHLQNKLHKCTHTLSNDGKWVWASFQGLGLNFILEFQNWMGEKGEKALEIMVAHFILQKIVFQDENNYINMLS